MNAAPLSLEPSVGMWNAWLFTGEAQDFVGAYATPELAERAVRDHFYNANGRGAPQHGSPLGEIQWGLDGKTLPVNYNAEIAVTDDAGVALAGRR